MLLPVQWAKALKMKVECLFDFTMYLVYIQYFITLLDRAVAFVCYVLMQFNVYECTYLYAFSLKYMKSIKMWCRELMMLGNIPCLHAVFLVEICCCGCQFTFATCAWHSFFNQVT